MSRKPKAAPEVLAPEASEQLSRDVALVNARTPDLALIDESFGEGMPYERDRIVNEARFYMGEAAQSMLEAGKRLILLKEHEPHGDFLEIIQGRLQLSPRTAQVMMKAALKYMSPALASKAQTFAQLGKAKLIELMVEDDEELAELADGGTVAGLTLDEVDRMSVRELRAALRIERKAQSDEAEAQAKLLAQKDKKINQLAGEVEKRTKYTPDQERAEAGERSMNMLKTLSDACLNLHAEIAKVAQVVGDIYSTDDPTTIEGANETIRWAFQSLADISLRHGIQVDFKDVVVPDWMRPMLAGAEAASA
jgi:hypothetical protein